MKKEVSKEEIFDDYELQVDMEERKLRELRKKQDELDEQIVDCPHCGKEEKWGFIREWGDCSRCVEKYMKEHEPNHPTKEDIYGKEEIKPLTN